MKKVIDRIESKEDRTVKLVLQSDNDFLEISLIDKQDGKDIICVPCQTGCRMGCRFCHLTEVPNKRPVRSLSKEEIADAVNFAIDQIPKRNPGLLVSYMGAGEPMLNVDGVTGSAKLISENFSLWSTAVRFAVSTIIPKSSLLDSFTDKLKSSKLNFKLHWSLHSPDEDVRKSLIPNADSIENSIKAIQRYKKETGNPVEVHYTLIDQVNDSGTDATRLSELAVGADLPVKILRFNPKPGADDLVRSKKENDFAASLTDRHVKVEIYEPPGRDIGSSCGQFRLDYY